MRAVLRSYHAGGIKPDARRGEITYPVFVKWGSGDEKQTVIEIFKAANFNREQMLSFCLLHSRNVHGRSPRRRRSRPSPARILCRKYGHECQGARQRLEGLGLDKMAASGTVRAVMGGKTDPNQKLLLASSRNLSKKFAYSTYTLLV